jgi:hypothetical protein
MERAGRLGAGTKVIIDLRGSSHLDPEILLQLRSIAHGGTAAPAPGTGAPAREPFRVTLAEPAELPICLLHAGADGEVLAGLDGLPVAVPLMDGTSGPLAYDPADLPVMPSSPSGLPAGFPTDDALSSGLDGACSPIPDELGTINGLELAEYFEGTLDPAATVRALSDVALGQLADALYRHLDTSSPSFGAHTWYELATEELQNRRLGGAGGSIEGELAAGPALA